jgi:hypothetical protein
MAGLWTGEPLEIDGAAAHSMSLQTKIYLILGVAFLALVVGGVMAFQAVVLDGFEDLERKASWSPSPLTGASGTIATSSSPVANPSSWPPRSIPQAC